MSFTQLGITESDSAVPLFSAAQIRQIELDYANHSQIKTYQLMQAAGAAVYQAIKQYWPNRKNMLILAGKGNNAGDGFVLAQLAAKDGFKVTLCHLAMPEQLKGDALIAYENINFTSITLIDWQSLKLDNYDLIVDAMLGTGIQGELKALYLQVVQAVNNYQSAKLAIDIPSGVNADTGYASTNSFKADVTVTFIGHKRGLYTGNAANYRGEVKLFNLGVENYLSHAAQTHCHAHNWQSVKHWLKPRSMDAHKGNFGHCHIIGGASGMSGAVILAASAAARSGCGWVSASMQQNASILLSHQPEIMAKNIDATAVNQRLQQLNKVNCLILGPGMDNKAWSDEIMRQLISRQSQQQNQKNLAKVWDAGALNWLAENPNFDEQRILTPHPGEAARLLAISVDQVNQDRFAASLAISRKYSGICVLKGSGTIISNAAGEQIVCAVGNPGMASAGMGDLLAGIIGALVAQGFNLMDASVLGVCIHGEAAERAATQDNHYRGLLASDLLDHLPALLNP